MTFLSFFLTETLFHRNIQLQKLVDYELLAVLNVKSDNYLFIFLVDNTVWVTNLCCIE